MVMSSCYYAVIDTITIIYFVLKIRLHIFNNFTLIDFHITIILIEYIGRQVYDTVYL